MTSSGQTGALQRATNTAFCSLYSLWFCCVRLPLKLKLVWRFNRFILAQNIWDRTAKNISDKRFCRKVPLQNDNKCKDPYVLIYLVICRMIVNKVHYEWRMASQHVCHFIISSCFWHHPQNAVWTSHAAVNACRVISVTSWREQHRTNTKTPGKPANQWMLCSLCCAIGESLIYVRLCIDLVCDRSFSVTLNAAETVTL